jgi:hypothetical protein
LKIIAHEQINSAAERQPRRRIRTDEARVMAKGNVIEARWHRVQERVQEAEDGLATGDETVVVSCDDSRESRSRRAGSAFEDRRPARCHLEVSPLEGDIGVPAPRLVRRSLKVGGDGLRARRN